MKLARSFSEEALRTLVGIMRDRKAPGAVRIKACEAVLHRGVGLPTQPVDITIQRLLAKKLVELNVDELRAIEQHLAEQAIDITPEAETPSSRKVKKPERSRISRVSTARMGFR